MKMEQNKARDSPKESPSHHTEMLLALLTHREELRKGTRHSSASVKSTFAVYAEQFCVYYEDLPEFDVLHLTGNERIDFILVDFI